MVKIGGIYDDAFSFGAGFTGAKISDININAYRSVNVKIGMEFSHGFYCCEMEGVYQIVL